MLTSRSYASLHRHARQVPGRAASPSLSPDDTIQLDWQDITVTIDEPLDVSKKRRFPFQRVPTAKTRILNGVSGSAVPGQTLAIMGPSGACSLFGRAGRASRVRARAGAH